MPAVDHRRAAKAALESAGFAYRHLAGIDAFLDGPDARCRNAAHVVFANEKVRPHEALANPDVNESEDAGQFRVIALDALVRVKLTAFRDKDRTHLRDLIDIGLVDTQWLAKLPSNLANRLAQLLETPKAEPRAPASAARDLAGARRKRHESDAKSPLSPKPSQTIPKHL